MITTIDLAFIEVHVTADDISRGWAGNCHRCPVALAAARAFPGCEVSVCTLEINVWDAGRLKHSFAVPKQVTAFIKRFDLIPDHGLKPFSFTLGK